MFGKYIGRSIERQLIVRIAVIFLIALAVVLSGFVYRVFAAYEQLNEIALQTQAHAIARGLTVADDGSVQVALPEDRRRQYSAASGAHFFAVLASNGRTVLSSDAAVALGADL